MTTKRPHPSELLTHAFELMNARGAEYDNAASLEQNFREAAAVVSVILGKALTARDVALVLHCVKLIRSKSAPEKLDNYVDGMNYLAFAACFTGLVPIAPLGAPAPKPEPAPLSVSAPAPVKLATTNG
jgi:hypothetical protein